MCEMRLIRYKSRLFSLFQKPKKRGSNIFQQVGKIYHYSILTLNLSHCGNGFQRNSIVNRNDI